MHPDLFHIGSVTVHTYGVFVALAIGVSFWIAEVRAARLGLDRVVIADLVFLLFISGIAGARLFFVFQHFSDYRDDLWRVFFLQEGGLVWYGGFITASACAVLYAAKRRLAVLSLCDFFSPILPLAHAIGRLGCFFNGCCYGRVAPKPWGIFFPANPVRAFRSSFTNLFCSFVFRRSFLRSLPAKDAPERFS